MADHAPHEAAAILGITPITLRRWCEYHKAYLSPSTQSRDGLARRITNRDIEVLKHVRSLRDQGLITPIINEQLAGLTFPEVDPLDQPDQEVTALESIPTAPNATDSALAVRVALDDIEKRFDAKLAATQQSREPSFFVGLGLGFIAAGVLFLLIVGVAILYGGFR